MGDLIFTVRWGRTRWAARVRVLYNFDKFLQDPIWALKIWEGGCLSTVAC